MSVEMRSQCSDTSDYENDSDNMDDDEVDYNYYYGDDQDVEFDKPNPCEDPEYFEYELLKIEDVDRLLNENVEALCSSLEIPPSLAKVLLHRHNWARTEVEQRHKRDPHKLMVDSKLEPAIKPKPPVISNSFLCSVCVQRCPIENMQELSCRHQYCKDCWGMYFKMQIEQGVSTGIECMGKDCNILATEDFVLSTVSQPEIRDKYQRFAFSDYVKSHPELRFCPGANCATVVRALESKRKRVVCKECKTAFCFKCGMDYHAPTDCDTIKKWLTKCADDSETANYISAHTKDCPKCHVCIEKNGGCNHMQCSKCKYDFCWMCLGDWKNHGSEYYECSRYKENPNIAHESVHVQAREALKKYLFYYERWENHAKSLALEEKTSQKIKDRINEKVMKNEGTWIDWQYLLDATALLKKCRYSLQFTYPYAYYMNKGARKTLFEYQQAQLEAEVENLSWKVERAEITDRGDLENQMDVAEKRRQTLLKDFLEV
ncbi:potential E3 ubiquitin-protein ligase ariadne-2 [Lingula anatina]|uniref:RBR-type E3 ubiquitin transferase n=1 Tax=Lingula anatina TaxID=7574 RepID=A0A1S3HIN4_LINAN|nr:potential E3 ubiquitin-protein ligase ariadne-2 [Lingula anatina]|eukprot:XP_013385980.1 potential E3 ubiquitin-protein ligase ariadne-2 [Lingula anatina]